MCFFCDILKIYSVIKSTDGRLQFRGIGEKAQYISIHLKSLKKQDTNSPQMRLFTLKLINFTGTKSCFLKKFTKFMVIN